MVPEMLKVGSFSMMIFRPGGLRFDDDTQEAQQAVKVVQTLPGRRRLAQSPPGQPDVVETANTRLPDRGASGLVRAGGRLCRRHNQAR